jgi:hypothetical protein
MMQSDGVDRDCLGSLLKNARRGLQQEAPHPKARITPAS